MYRTLGHREEILRGVLSADLRRGTLTSAAGGEAEGQGIRMGMGWPAAATELGHASEAAPPHPLPPRSADPAACSGAPVQVCAVASHRPTHHGRAHHPPGAASTSTTSRAISTPRARACWAQAAPRA
jgi:hypothetical protein